MGGLGAREEKLQLKLMGGKLPSAWKQTQQATVPVSRGQWAEMALGCLRSLNCLAYVSLTLGLTSGLGEETKFLWAGEGSFS